MSRYLMNALLQHCPALGHRLALVRARLSARWCHAHGSVGEGSSLSTPLQVMGLRFANPLGIAAGFDRRGELGRQVGRLGFGHIEVGTLMPEGEPLRRAGERSAGASGTILGISIGMSPRSSPHQACADYLTGLRAAWSQADYVAINLCSRQAAGLLQPPQRETLEALLVALKREQRSLSVETGRHVPLVVKIKLAPETRELPEIVSRLAALRFDGLIAAIDAGPPATPQRHADWQAPERQRNACRLVERLVAELAGRLPLISVGGISSAEHAGARLQAGAALVQLHNALLYEGPRVALTMHEAARRPV